jgi:hypothetical protein
VASGAELGWMRVAFGREGEKVRLAVVPIEQ